MAVPSDYSRPLRGASQPCRKGQCSADFQSISNLLYRRAPSRRDFPTCPAIGTFPSLPIGNRRYSAARHSRHSPHSRNRTSRTVWSAPGLPASWTYSIRFATSRHRVKNLDIAAPEDGRTPPRRSPAAADPVRKNYFSSLRDGRGVVVKIGRLPLRRGREP